MEIQLQKDASLRHNVNSRTLKSKPISPQSSCRVFTIALLSIISLQGTNAGSTSTGFLRAESAANLPYPNELLSPEDLYEINSDGDFVSSNNNNTGSQRNDAYEATEYSDVLPLEEMMEEKIHLNAAILEEQEREIEQRQGNIEQYMVEVEKLEKELKRVATIVQKQERQKAEKKLLRLRMSKHNSEAKLEVARLQLQVETLEKAAAEAGMMKPIGSIISTEGGMAGIEF